MCGLRSGTRCRTRRRLRVPARARGHGYAAERSARPADAPASHGLRRVLAITSPGNGGRSPSWRRPASGSTGRRSWRMTRTRFAFTLRVCDRATPRRPPPRPLRRPPATAALGGGGDPAVHPGELPPTPSRAGGRVTTPLRVVAPQQGLPRAQGAAAGEVDPRAWVPERAVARRPTSRGAGRRGAMPSRALHSGPARPARRGWRPSSAARGVRGAGRRSRPASSRSATPARTEGARRARPLGLPQDPLVAQLSSRMSMPSCLHFL